MSLDMCVCTLVVMDIILGERTKIFLIDKVLVNGMEDAANEMSIHYDPICYFNQDVELVYPVSAANHVKKHLF